MVTIKHVARAAGVSLGTASHVLTGAVRVSEPLRLKVLAAMRQLDYSPNRAASSLRSHKTRTLGLVVSDVTLGFVPQLIVGAGRAARVRGYSLVVANSEEDAGQQQEALSMLRAQRVEGILLLPAADLALAASIAHLQEGGVPVVAVDRVPDGCRVDSVSMGNAEAARMAVGHLIATGNRRIAIVTGPLGVDSEYQRLLGYRQALRGGGIAFHWNMVWEGNLSGPDVTALVYRNLNRQASLPDAMLCTNCPAALSALRALQNRGLSTPEDLAFATFGELGGDELFRPSITTVEQPAHEIGYRAVELLLERIADGPSADVVALRLPATLRIRETSRRCLAA